MRKLFIAFYLLFFATSICFSQDLPFLKNSAFQNGETLKYKVKYGFLTAAEATLQVAKTDVRFDSNPAYHLIVQGSTSGTFDIFYKVRNRYDSYIDQKNYTPYLFTESIREDKYTRTDKARFYQDEQKVVAKKGTFKSPVAQTFDLISAYYFARNLDLSNSNPGDEFSLNYFLDDEVSPLTIQYLGKEVIKTNLGRIRCLKFSPSIKPGRIFKRGSNLYLWITDDANRIPVKAQAEIIVGSLTFEIASVNGLKQPLEASK